QQLAPHAQGRALEHAKLEVEHLLVRNPLRDRRVELAATTVGWLDRKAVCAEPSPSLKLTHDPLVPVIEPVQRLPGAVRACLRQAGAEERDPERLAPFSSDELHESASCLSLREADFAPPNSFVWARA